MIFDAATSFSRDYFIELAIFVLSSIFLFWWRIYKSEKPFAQNAIMNSKVEYEEQDDLPQLLHKVQRDALASSEGGVSFRFYVVCLFMSNFQLC